MLNAFIADSDLAASFVFIVAHHRWDRCVVLRFRAVASVEAVPRTSSPEDLHASFRPLGLSILFTIRLVDAIHSRVIVVPL